MENGYILGTWDNELTQIVLDYINDHIFVNVRSLRKLYCSMIRFNEDQTMSITIKLGRIMKELKELGFVSN